MVQAKLVWSLLLTFFTLDSTCMEIIAAAQRGDAAAVAQLLVPRRAPIRPRRTRQVWVARGAPRAQGRLALDVRGMGRLGYLCASTMVAERQCLSRRLT